MIILLLISAIFFLLLISGEVTYYNRPLASYLEVGRTTPKVSFPVGSIVYLKGYATLETAETDVPNTVEIQDTSGNVIATPGASTNYSYSANTPTLLSTVFGATDISWDSTGATPGVYFAEWKINSTLHGNAIYMQARFEIVAVEITYHELDIATYSSSALTTKKACFQDTETVYIDGNMIARNIGTTNEVNQVGIYNSSDVLQGTLLVNTSTHDSTVDTSYNLKTDINGGVTISKALTGLTAGTYYVKWAVSGTGINTTEVRTYFEVEASSFSISSFALSDYAITTSESTTGTAVMSTALTAGTNVLLIVNGKAFPMTSTDYTTWTKTLTGAQIGACSAQVPTVMVEISSGSSYLDASSTLTVTQPTDGVTERNNSEMDILKRTIGSQMVSSTGPISTYTQLQLYDGIPIQEGRDGLPSMLTPACWVNVARGNSEHTGQSSHEETEYEVDVYFAIDSFNDMDKVDNKLDYKANKQRKMTYILELARELIYSSTTNRWYLNFVKRGFKPKTLEIGLDDSLSGVLKNEVEIGYLSFTVETTGGLKFGNITLTETNGVTGFTVTIKDPKNETVEDTTGDSSWTASGAVATTGNIYGQSGLVISCDKTGYSTYSFTDKRITDSGTLALTFAFT